MIEDIKKIVQAVARENDWRYHILPVVKYALELAEAYGADLEIVEISALLHDIGRQKNGPDNHEITGQAEARKILSELNYDKDKTEKIIHCIASHRGSKDVAPETIEAKIVANADALAHFDVVPMFFYWHDENEKLEDIVNWVEEKLARDWEKKLTLPEARELVAKQYEEIKDLLNLLKKY